MALYAIGDLHLSLGGDKSMEVFGGRWENYVGKIKTGFSALTDEDVCVLCGDISWGASLEESREDFRFLARLPGRKILVKGNHDYWWSTAAKMQRFFAENGIENLDILNNNSYVYGDWAICGTRGWFYEEERGDAHDKKIMNREIGRLEASLRSAGAHKKLVFLHYPPKYMGYACAELLELLERYEVPLCCYGHIHSKGCAWAFQGRYGQTQLRLLSADYVNFRPVKILD